MWTLGDIILWGTLAIGIIPVAKLFWKSYGKRLVSAFFPERPPEITSSSRLSVPSDLSVSKTDAIKEVAAPPPVMSPKPTTLDSCKLMRGYGLTRDQARAVAKSMDRTLDNNVWAQAQPAQEDDEIVTPYAGRQTKRSYYPDEPQLEYKELEA